VSGVAPWNDLNSGSQQIFVFDGSLTSTVFFVPNIWDHFPEGLEPATQVKEETKQVKELVEEEVEDPEDAEKKKTVKKEVTVDKVVQVVQWRPYEISLHSLLEFDCTRPTTDDIVEFCLFADCFHEMLQRDFDILKQKKIEAVENDKKRKREEEAAAEKNAKLENGAQSIGFVELTVWFFFCEPPVTIFPHSFVFTLKELISSFEPELS